jgi:hypothetical protein
MNRGNNSEATAVNAVDSVAIRDSLRKVALIREEEDKVLGDLRFLISREEYYRNTEKYFAPFSYPEEKDSYRSNRYHIGNYEFFTNYYLFFEDKLYYIQLLGDHVSYNNYDYEILRNYKSIYDVFRAKYGTPDVEIAIPAPYEMKTDHSYRIAEWRIGRKTVQIGVVDKATYYRIDVFIFRSDIVEQREAKERLEESDKTEAAVDLI